MTDARVEPGEAAGFDGRLAHDTLVVTACTMLSRLSGFVRVLVAAAVLSTGPLGDTYHAANMIPNLVFELIAGGVFQAVLVPVFVGARRHDGDEALGRVAGVVLGFALVVLGTIAVVVMALSPLLARALTALESDPTLSADKQALITPMLLVFVPQIIFYGIGMVTTAALAARGRFAAAALAPAVNNLVVIGFYLGFGAARDGEPASLDLSRWEFALLAGGTTLAVIAFTVVPGIVLASQGVNWRPRWALSDPAVRQLRSSVGWAMLSVVGTLVPMAAAMVLGSGAPGAVAVFSLAFTFFALPHALFAVPVATAMAPRVADTWQRGLIDDTADRVERSVQVVVASAGVASAAMIALAWPIASVVASIGQAGSQGPDPIADAIASFGLGLTGYGLAVVLTRVLYGLDEVRAAALRVMAGAAVGVLVMVVASVLLPERDRASALALGYGAAQTVSAVLLAQRTRALVGAPSWSATGRLAAGSLGAAVLAGVGMWWVQQLFGPGRPEALAAIAVAGATGIAVYALALVPLAGLHPSALLRRGTGAR